MTALERLVAAGGALFHQNCAFCHGRDAMGGETGPDLTARSCVLGDTTGDKIAEVVREGRPEKRCPPSTSPMHEIEQPRRLHPLRVRMHAAAA